MHSALCLSLGVWGRSPNEKIWRCALVVGRAILPVCPVKASVLATSTSASTSCLEAAHHSRRDGQEWPSSNVVRASSFAPLLIGGRALLPVCMVKANVLAKSPSASTSCLEAAHHSRQDGQEWPSSNVVRASSWASRIWRTGTPARRAVKRESLPETTSQRKSTREGAHLDKSTGTSARAPTGFRDRSKLGRPNVAFIAPREVSRARAEASWCDSIGRHK
mgnify:CR=1 FL=1